MGSLKTHLRHLPCLICGVDSGPIRNFLILTIGSLVAATICIGIWSWSTGRLREDKNTGFLALKADEKETL